MQIHLIHQWAGVALLGLVAADDDPVVGERASCAFRFDLQPARELWSADAILGNWTHRIRQRYWRIGQAPPAPLAHVDAIQGWIDQTSAIARDLRAVYGDSLAASLEQIAGEAAETIGWLDQQTIEPAKDPRARANLLLAVDLWAFDQVRAVLMSGRRAVDGVPARDKGRTHLLAPVIEALSAAGLQTVTSDFTLRSRVQRVRVQPGREDALVADVLAACRTGPYDQNGQAKTISTH